MNLGQLRAEALNHGFDPVQYGSRIATYINDGLQLVAARVDYYLDDRAYPITTAAGNPSYQWPTDTGRVRSLFNQTLNQELQSVDIREIDRSAPAQGAPCFYALAGTLIDLYPTPDAAYQLILRYWKTPTPLVNDSDVPALPATWHKLLWEYAVQQAFEADDDAQMGQYWGQKFDKDLSMFAADVKFPSSDRPTVVDGMWDQNPSLNSGNSWALYLG